MGITAPASLDAAQAQEVLSQAAWDKATQDLHRQQRLSNEARSQEQLEQALAAEKTTHASLQDAQAKLRSAKTAPTAIAQAQATRDQGAAQVKQAEADLAQAELDLANTKVLAPRDGHIAKRGVARGNYVQPGQALTALVGANIWVIAHFKETQLRTMHPGLPVAIHVDAYPQLKMTGKVESIQSGTGAFFSAFPPENATGNFVKVVQRVPVKILLDTPPDPALVLGPGMSVVPTVFMDRQD
ncbi:MAG: HlyD family secretion protein [Magnetococcales bacterium]|nr:HlyD family secretion protein [Magnetococcales bacterium]